ncbi:extracellular matrix regulator RemB [Anaerosalibacter sp. Marseille-P3206]|uniref:extracellular matrix regulator RemB n=1 Tax=Anaerosalibacter sp. Marseille-P3206 TaxID=1871005 RepID=UPI0009848931|nr:extracellular matrix/biofilm biosynthesis regulator RemA family protein [Anaerosalibacter sp. Marseille-P3206]
MFLHIGNNKIIPVSEIIAIIDAKSYNSSSEMKKYIENNNYNDVKDDDYATYIVTSREGYTNVYASNISSSTLLKRCNAIDWGEFNGQRK